MFPVATDKPRARDPARTLALLWRDPGPIARRGPERGLDVHRIVAAAARLADAEGLTAVTMRRVAQSLGVGAMTLYTYVPDKTALIDLMLDDVYARMPRTDTTARPWRERLTAVAEDNRALYRTHPWAAEVPMHRPPLGPGTIAKYEHELSALDGLGLDDVTMDDCLTYLLTFVQACARTANEHRAIRQDSQMDDEQWWAANAPLLADRKSVV
jgi:AcrR family transcriptional regulator